MKRQGRQNAQLIGRVIPLHVRSRIRFGQTELLCVSQHVGVCRAFTSHACQNIIRRAVDDAHHRIDPVRLKRIIHRANDRHGAANARFVIQSGRVLLRRADNLRPMRRERHLVGGNDRLAIRQRAHDIGSRGLLTAHELHHNVDFRIIQYILRVIRQQRRRNCPCAVFIQRTHENFAHFKSNAFVFLHLRSIGFQQFIYAAADVAAAEKSHDDLFHAFVRPFLIMQSSYRLRS